MMKFLKVFGIWAALFCFAFGSYFFSTWISGLAGDAPAVVLLVRMISGFIGAWAIVVITWKAL